MALHQGDILAFDEQQGNADNRNRRQYNQRQTQAKYSLVSKSQHCNFVIVTPPVHSVADSAARSEVLSARLSEP